MTEEKRLGYITSDRCTLCNAHDRNGNPLRDLIDSKKDQGWTDVKIAMELLDDGIKIAPKNVFMHFKKHSPWLLEKKRQLRRAKAMNLTNAAETMHRNAEEEIQRLIDMGGQRIDDGELLVDKELFMFALRSKTENKTPMSIQNLVMNFGDALIDAYMKPTKVEKLQEVVEIE